MIETISCAGRRAGRLAFVLVVTAGATLAGAAGPLDVWNGDLVSPRLDFAADRAGAVVEPIKLVGARNGAFSGKVIVSSKTPIKNLRAEVTALVGKAGGVIPAQAVDVFYPKLTRHGTWRAVSEAISFFDVLSPTAPADVPVLTKHWAKRIDWIPLNRAYQPVWVRVRVPAGAKAGSYSGKLTIRADGAAATTVPIELTVHPWTLPETADYATFVELIQSPESVAMEYGLPLWSDKHFSLMAQSFKLIGSVGSRSVYIPLIRQTNQGNSETMVRWIPRADGKYDYDFSVMEKYLDTAEANMGKPKLIVLYVWDLFLEGGQFTGDIKHISKEAREDRLAYKGKGPTVTQSVAGKLSVLQLPPLADPASRALWQPMLRELRSRLAKRGLDKTIMYGTATDAVPTSRLVGLFADILPSVEWVIHSHSFWRGRDKKLAAGRSAVGYAALVAGYWATDAPDRRAYAWRTPLVHFHRGLRNNHPMTIYRLIGEMNITGRRRGFGRLGGDFWSVLKTRRGRRIGPISRGRYPKSIWRNLNILTSLLAAGQAGPLSTARLEVLREGVQECEARIFIEKAIVLGKLPKDLASRCQDVLDARMVVMRKTLAGSTHGVQFGMPRKEGHDFYVGSDWRASSDKLYAAAAEVAKALGVDSLDMPPADAFPKPARRR